MITLELQGDPTAGLDRFLDKVANPGASEVRKVADAIAQGIHGIFTAEGGREGPWRQLAGITQIKRKDLGFAPAHPIMVRTGSFRASFVQRGAANHVEDYRRTAGGWMLEVGSADERRNLLHFGGYTVIDGNRVYVPPRPIVDLPQDAEQRIVSVIDFIVDEIAKRELRAG